MFLNAKKVILNILSLGYPFEHKFFSVDRENLSCRSVFKHSEFHVPMANMQNKTR